MEDASVLRRVLTEEGLRCSLPLLASGDERLAELDLKESKEDIWHEECLI